MAKQDVTRWQLDVLDAAAQGSGRTFADVARNLGVSRGQVVSTLDRLRERLSVDRDLVEETDLGLRINNPEVVRVAALVRERMRDLDGAARSPKEWWIRLDGYPAHLSAFLAPAWSELEREWTGHGKDRFRLELAPTFGEARATAGAGLVRAVQRGEVDLAVAPAMGRRAAERRGLGYRESHRVLLLAAVDLTRRPFDDVQIVDGTLDIDDLRERMSFSGPGASSRKPHVVKRPLVASPIGHASRDVLDRMDDPADPLRIVFSHPDPTVLAALGPTGVIPIISSDSALPPSVTRASADNPWSIPEDWPVLVAYRRDAAGGRAGPPIALGRDYAIYYRIHKDKAERQDFRETMFVPEAVSVALEQLAEKAADQARIHLHQRVERWTNLEVSDKPG